jgi:phenylacetate-CoA ligase
MVAVSSGSTGKPTFWPRALADELAVAVRFEQIFRDSFRAGESSTLAVVCFALGTWVGGIYTANCSRHLAAKGYRVTVVTPGNNKEEIFRIMADLAPQFEQIVLLGYPPFIKDAIDTGISRGVDWKRHRMRMVFAGEVFSEEWRGLICERAGIDTPASSTASLYGTADAGVLANETPLSNSIRAFLAEKPAAARALFGESRLPTLAQYDPAHRYFEVQDGRLIFTGDNGVPLVRYDILDSGGVIGYQQILDFLSMQGWNAESELSDLAAQTGSTVAREMPFVYVFGRSDFTVSYFGANVYPENVTVGLEAPEIAEFVTGKFVLQVAEGQDLNLTLSLTVEMAAGMTASEERAARIEESVIGALTRINSEFAHYVSVEFQRLTVRLAPAGDPEWFPTGVKHRYTRK